MSLRASLKPCGMAQAGLHFRGESSVGNAVPRWPFPYCPRESVRQVRLDMGGYLEKHSVSSHSRISKPYPSTC